MAVDPKYIVKLQGKDFPLWAGILDAATVAGLISIITTVVQIPSDENKGMAVVIARAEFKDGRVFTGIGDCSPTSVPNPRLLPASLRVAETRAKGRALRDALNIGETMYEEMPDDEQQQPQRSAKPSQNQQRSSQASPQESPPPIEPPATMEGCVQCGTVLTGDEIKAAAKYFGGRGHCTSCGKAELARMVAEEKAAKAG